MRNYDPQIGRWVEQDPYGEFPSPYTGMGNDPVSYGDPSGGFLGLSTLASIGVKTLAGAMIGTAVDIISGGDGTTGLIAGAAAGLLSNLSGLLSNLSGALRGTVSFVISFGSKSVGSNIETPAIPFNSSTSNANAQQGSIEDMVREDFCNGKYLEGIEKIIQGYSELGFVVRARFSLADDPKGVFHTKPYIVESKIDNQPSGIIGYNKTELSKFAQGTRSFGYVVRGLFHELYLIQQLLGLGRWANNREIEENSQQFSAIILSITNAPNLPKYNDEEMGYYLYLARKFYDLMPAQKKAQYKDLYDKLLPLEKQYSKAIKVTEKRLSKFAQH